MKSIRISKSFIATSLSIALLAGLSGCGKADPSTVRPVTRTVGSVVDAGAVDLPNRPGYRLRHYEVLRDMQVRHYLYVIEKDDVPVAGVDGQYQSGKTRVSVDTIVATPQLAKACEPPENCMSDAERQKMYEDYRRYQELKAKFEKSDTAKH